MNKVDFTKRTSINGDFALWAAEQGALLRAGKIERIDVENVADEIESLGRGDKFEIDSRMEVLILHLLKWQFQPTRRSNSWKASIVEQRLRIARILAQSPSLKSYSSQNMAGSFVLGRGRAIDETRLPESAFPETCPYGADEALDGGFWPGGPELPLKRSR
jgi:hypothetical protein